MRKFKRFRVTLYGGWLYDHFITVFDPVERGLQHSPYKMHNMTRGPRLFNFRQSMRIKIQQIIKRAYHNPFVSINVDSTYECYQMFDPFSFGFAGAGKGGWRSLSFWSLLFFLFVPVSRRRQILRKALVIFLDDAGRGYAWLLCVWATWMRSRNHFCMRSLMHLIAALLFFQIHPLSRYASQSTLD